MQGREPAPVEESSVKSPLARRLALAPVLAVAVPMLACPPPWVYREHRHERHERHDDHRDERHERHDDNRNERHERHDDNRGERHERHDDRHERH
jgi:hypothetical protein